MWLYHGEDDVMIRPRNAELTYKYLGSHIYTDEFKANYNYTLQPHLGHKMDHNEIKRLDKWLKTRFKTYKKG